MTKLLRYQSLSHAMNFHSEFLWLQAAAEMQFAAAVENQSYLPEWQNPVLMNYTNHDDTLLLVLEALQHAHSSSLLALRYVPQAASIASARLLGQAIHDEHPVQTTGIFDGFDEPIGRINAADKASESSFPLFTSTTPTTVQERRVEERTRQQELMSDARVAVIADQHQQDIMVANQQQETTSTLLVEEHVNWIRSLEIARQQLLREQEEIVMRSDHQMIGTPINEFSLDDSFAPNLAYVPSQELLRRFENSGIFDDPAPALMIYVTNEPSDERMKQEQKQVEELQSVTKRKRGRTQSKRTMRNVGGGKKKWIYDQYTKLVEYKDKDRNGGAHFVEES